MTDILTAPCRANERSKVVYFFNGATCCDVQSGTEEQQRAAFLLVSQAQEMAWALRPLANTQCEGMADCGGHRGGLCPPCRARAVLRAAGVSDPSCTVEGR
jgi:hypothetical protein